MFIHVYDVTNVETMFNHSKLRNLQVPENLSKRP